MIDTIVGRAPADAAAGGAAALRAAVERLLENWQTTVDELRADDLRRPAHAR